MFKTVLVLVCLLVLWVTPPALLAQEDSDEACPAAVEMALEAVDSNCSGTGRNQVCYGNNAIEVALQPGVTDLQFNSAGDIADLTDIQSLTLNEMDSEAGAWGVALLRVQASLPDTNPGQNVTVLLFGDVQISQASDSANPMQSFYFQSGVGEVECQETPPNGMLVQTPEGVTTITMTVNGVDMEIGSTAFIQAYPADEDHDEGELVVNLLEGEATISANDVEVIIPAGQFSTVPLDENLEAAGTPAEPQDYDAAAFAALPLPVLEREIVVAGLDEGLPPQLLSGTWLLTSSALEFGEGCPAEMAGIMGASFPQIVEENEIDWSGGFNAETYLGMIQAQGIDVLAQGATVTSPEPGVILMEYAGQGATIVFEMRVVSERLIETTMTATITEGITCTFVWPINLEYQD